MTRTTFLLFALCVCIFTLSACVPEGSPLSVLVSPKQKGADNGKAKRLSRPSFSKDKIVTCSVFEGQAQFVSGWFPIEKNNFEIAQGHVLSVPLKKRKHKDSINIQVRFDPEGQKMVFCPEKIDAQKGDRISCTSIYALEDDFVAGIKRTFDVPKTIRGSALQCQYAQN